MSDYQPPLMAVTVDVAVFTKRDERHLVALIERRNDPYQGAWALPGGFVELDEDLPVAASRELAEETGVQVDPGHLTQVGAYGTPGRDPRMRVVSVLYHVFVPDPPDPSGASDAADARFFGLEEALSPGFDLAFDHVTLLSDAAKAAGL